MGYLGYEMSSGAELTTPPPGVFVLGMHRSGTSVVAGLLDRLGLEAGPRESMLSPDQFNSDGYWEQRPVVEWHDSVLARLNGWASAPPRPLNAPEAQRLAAELREEATGLLTGLYSSAWFMKDPRQCLLLDLWSGLRGNSELAVVVSRDPAEVVRSLQRRNAYPRTLAAALWERHSRDLLMGLGGRPCLFIGYEQLTADPEPAVALLAEVLSRHVSGPVPYPEKASDAVALVRAPRDPAPSGTSKLSAEQRALHELFSDLSGYHPKFEVPDTIPPPSAGSVEVIDRRRARLNRFGPLLRSSSDTRATLDRIPSLLRRFAGRLGMIR